MTAYRVASAPLPLPPRGGCVLHPTEQQLAARRHCVERVTSGLLVTAPVEFKCGEVVEIVAGDIAGALPCLSELSGKS